MKSFQVRTLKPKITTDKPKCINQMIKLGKRRARYFAQEMSIVACNAIKILLTLEVLSAVTVVGWDLLCCMSPACPNHLEPRLKSQSSSSAQATDVFFLDRVKTVAIIARYWELSPLLLQM